MKQKIGWRVGLVLAIIALSVFFYFKNGVKLGLDLKGGVHLVLLMDTDVSIYNRVQADINTAKETLQNNNVPYDKIYSLSSSGNAAAVDVGTVESYLKSNNVNFGRVYAPSSSKNAIIVEGPDPNLEKTLKELIAKQMKRYSLARKGKERFQLTLSEQYAAELAKKAKKGPVDSFIVEGRDPNLGLAVRDLADKQLNNYDFKARGKGVFQLTLKKSYERKLRDDAVQQSVEVIRNRIDKYGVSEPMILRQGINTNKIVVELPGVEDSTEIKALIGKAAQLEWHLAVGPKSGAPTREELIKDLGGKVPDDVTIYEGATDKFSGKRFFALKSVSPITGADIDNVSVTSNQYGQPAVGFQLNARAGERFRMLTRNHIHDVLAIVLDGYVISAPVINAEIGDSGIIEGNFSPREARELVFQLKSGALPALPRFAEERSVGPSLGLESIRRGTLSGLIGLICIFIFMFLYYRASGLNANVCLLLNFVILLGIMTTFGLTLTVPGIAGIILTLGMAIDANVLVFERIKEELIEKKAVTTAIVNGFGKAFLTIFDSNVTTLVAALFLLQFGTGPVRGFAITLTVGLLVSIFTAVFVSRLIYDLVMSYRTRGGQKVSTLSIGSLKIFQNLNIPFMKYKFVLLSVSLVLIAIGVFSLATKGINWGIDFRGGQEMQVRYTGTHKARTIEGALRKATGSSITVVRIGQPEDNEFLIRMDAKDKAGNLLNEEQLTKKNQLILKTLRTKAALSELSGGKLDLNTANTKAIADMIQDGINKGIISGGTDTAELTANAIQEYKKLHNGLLASVESLKKIPAISNAMFSYLAKRVFTGAFTIESIDSVGPTVGKELRNKAIGAVIGSIIGILLYAWFRFKFRFSVGAILALIHDTLIAVGFLSLFHVEVNLPTIAALLTLVGYSINDTIVVYDRIRERMKTARKAEDAPLINRAINETLSRTLITSVLTFFVVFAMLVYGGKVLFSFSFVLVVGIIVGTYSSIFIASPFALLWKKLGMDNLFRKKRRIAR